MIDTTTTSANDSKASVDEPDTYRGKKDIHFQEEGKKDDIANQSIKKKEHAQTA